MEYARKIFLMYLKPVINDNGNYYVEAEARDAKRTDIVVDYHGMQEKLMRDKTLVEVAV